MANTNLYLDYEGLRYYHGKLQEQIDADHALIAQALEALDNKTEIQIGGETPSDEDIKLYIDENSDYAVVYTAALTELLINQAAAQIPTRVSLLTNDSNYATSSEVDQRIQLVVGAAPAALDTLGEIADKLGDNDDAIAGIIETLGLKADAADVEALELGEINVQSDWNQSDSTEDDFIKNKPTNVSAFTNDAGYLTLHLDISGKANASDVYTKQEVDNLVSGVDVSDQLSNYYTKDDIDNAGYLTQHLDISGKANKADLAEVATSGDYNDLSNKPTITPAEVEIVANSSATISNGTKIVIDTTANTSVEVYSKALVDAMIANIYLILRNNGLTV